MLNYKEPSGFKIAKKQKSVKTQTDMINIESKELIKDIESSSFKRRIAKTNAKTIEKNKLSESKGINKS